MGIFRLAAVVAVGVSLLPADRESQERLYQRAASAASWTMTFCERNAAACTQASGLWSEFSKKAEFGAKLAFDVVRDNENGAALSPQPAAQQRTRPLDQSVSGTLTNDDLRPAWRGKMASKAGS